MEDPSRTHTILDAEARNRITQVIVVPGTLAKSRPRRESPLLRHEWKLHQQISTARVDATRNLKAKVKLMVAFAPSHRATCEGAYTRFCFNTSLLSSSHTVQGLGTVATQFQFWEQ